MPFTFTILVAAQDSSDCRNLVHQIESEFKAPVQRAISATELTKCVKNGCPDIIVMDTDSARAGFDLALAKTLCKSLPETVILPLIPTERRELLGKLLQLDIRYFLHTPIEPAETTLTLTRAAEHLATKRKNHQRPVTREQGSFHGMIGNSAPMKKLFDFICKVADDDESTVLIHGESGTGKEMVAKAIHLQSSRSKKNFVPVNCAAIPDDLLESELFGYAKGAFTGATSNKIGRIQYADGGTLFLDEIGDMKPALQAKLLRVLQEKEFEPVGSLKATPVDTRILAATHRDLEQLVSEGQFREDLYYRLSVIPLTIPPLKKRTEDIPLLVETFIHNYTVKRNRAPYTFSPAAMAALLHYEWRGNVRELENLIQHMSILYSGGNIDFDDLPEKFLALREHVETVLNTPVNTIQHEDKANQEQPDIANNTTVDWSDGEIDFKELINSFETELILQAMRKSEGNKKEAARLLGLKRTTLLEKIKKKELNEIWNER